MEGAQLGPIRDNVGYTKGNGKSELQETDRHGVWLSKIDKIYPGSTTHGSMRIYHPSPICIWQAAGWSGVCGSSLKTNCVLLYRQNITIHHIGVPVVPSPWALRKRWHLTARFGWRRCGVLRAFEKNNPVLCPLMRCPNLDLPELRMRGAGSVGMRSRNARPPPVSYVDGREDNRPSGCAV